MQTVERQTRNIRRPVSGPAAVTETLRAGTSRSNGRHGSAELASSQGRSRRVATARTLEQECPALPAPRWIGRGVQPALPMPVYEGMKRSADVLLALCAVLALAPVGCIIALLIWMEDRGPIFYWQERVGKHGKRFRFYKFRSMVTNADQVRQQLEAKNEAVGPIFKMKNDPRITRVGRVLRKYSLDELPQFFNVLRGEMSLVGPRPHLPKEVAQYEPGQEERLLVAPGLVCLREVCGRSRLTFDEWIALDLLYVKHRNVVLDLWILVRLIPAVLTADGAY
ncbi:MAG: sugar transferase [Capsulimonadales bacterium]|nr:sugar transferase [Capsulimonadales bacterium]